MKKIKEYIVNFINGFCMALADSVPGVSGGTVAFILGFYDKFITALDDLFRGDLKKKKAALIYLVKLGIGWLVGMVMAVLFLSRAFENNIYEMSSLFLGFIIFAIPIVIKEEKESIKGKYQNVFFTLIGALLVVLITYLNSGAGNTFNIDSFNLGTVIYTFLAAMLAISAMILPGVSGSTILLIFGLYIPIINKIKLFLHFDFISLWPRRYFWDSFLYQIVKKRVRKEKKCRSICHFRNDACFPLFHCYGANNPRNFL